MATELSRDQTFVKIEEVPLTHIQEINAASATAWELLRPPEVAAGFAGPQLGLDAGDFDEAGYQAMVTRDRLAHLEREYRASQSQPDEAPAGVPPWRRGGGRQGKRKSLTPEQRAALKEGMLARAAALRQAV